jgi:hypothetical protein
MALDAIRCPAPSEFGINSFNHVLLRLLMTRTTRFVTVLLKQVSGNNAPRSALQFVTLTAASLALLALPAPAHAGLLQVSIDEPGNPGSTIMDNGPGDLNPAPNAILALVPANLTEFSGSVTVSSNNPGDGTQGTLNLVSNISATVNSPPLLGIDALQFGFSLPSTAGSSVKLTSTLAVAALSMGFNNVTLLSSSDGNQTPAQTLLSPGTYVQSLTFTRGVTYDLDAESIVRLFNANDNTNYTATVTVSPVPEPSSIVILLGFAGVGLIGMIRHCRRAA